MKKITLLIAFIGMITLQSCTVNEVQDNVDNDTIAEVFELRNKNLFRFIGIGEKIFRNKNIFICRMRAG